MGTCTEPPSPTEGKWEDAISVNRHLNQLYPFMGVEKSEPQEQIRGLVADGAAGTLAPEAATQLEAAHDEFAD